MPENWFRRFVDNVAGNIAAALLMSAISAIWAAVKDVPGYLILPITAITFGAFFWLLNQLRNRREQTGGENHLEIKGHLENLRRWRGQILSAVTADSKARIVRVAALPNPKTTPQSEQDYEIASRQLARHGWRIEGWPIVFGCIRSEGGFEFYQSRKALSQMRTLKDQLDSAETIWAMWNTGTQAYVSDAIRYAPNKIRKLILPHSRQAPLDILAYAARKEGGANDFAKEIIKLTREAKDRYVPVRWFPKLYWNTVMIGNPLSDNRWAHVETLLASVSAEERPSFRVTEPSSPGLMTSLLNAFNEIWDNSVEPTDEDLRDDHQ